MLKIYKVSNGSAIDFAAEELKKYLRMMLPEENDICISFNPLGADGFRLGLFSDLGIEGEVEDVRFDDMLYAECNEKGGVIAGINERSVLLAVYEYLRQNGLRWLFPGPDGEYIPVKEINPVSFKITPSCRYRGIANATAASYQTTIDLVDFLPKIGMNTFMVEFRLPLTRVNLYYSHIRNEQNRAPESVSSATVLRWKRGSECEAKRRGLLFHDVGHGFCCDAFGIDSRYSAEVTDDSSIPDSTRKYLAEIGGKRGYHRGLPLFTNFCMSNPEARALFTKYVADYAERHKNIDLLHVWLADEANNHCECENCQKKTATDWYVLLLNELDELMSARNIDTKIVFLSYVDTSWAPVEERIKNQDRFVFMLAPFTRSYYDSIPKGEIRPTTSKYERNKVYLAKTLEEYLGFYNDWREDFKGPAFAFEYHFCWCEYYDLSTFKHSKTIHDEIALYKSMGIDGVVECGDLRGFLPNGLQFYTMGRTLFDTSLSAEEIAEDYMSHAYGNKKEKFKKILCDLESIIPHAYLSRKASANDKVSSIYNPAVAKNIEERLPTVLEAGRRLVKENYNSDVRVETVSVRLFEHYLDLVEWLGKLFSKKAAADDEGAKAIYPEFEDYFGKKECELERYFNQCFFFNYLNYYIFSASNTSKTEFIL